MSGASDPTSLDRARAAAATATLSLSSAGAGAVRGPPAGISAGVYPSPATATAASSTRVGASDASVARGKSPKSTPRRIIGIAAKLSAPQAAVMLIAAE